MGVTGSIGQQTLQVIAKHPERFEVPILSAGHRVEELCAVATTLKGVRAVLLPTPSGRAQAKQLLGGTSIAVHDMASFGALLDDFSVDNVLMAIVGFAALRPTLDALERGKVVALANKETLVAGGELVMPLVSEQQGRLLPVDSEHSALFQCLMGEQKASVSKLILTASGGPFWKKSLEEMAVMTPEMALKHPRWSMGAKVSIDSATMMNKGLEVMEAYWLFGLPAKQIEVLVHPQSFVHGIAEFVDGSQKAQLGPTDMCLPIQFALSYPLRLPSPCTPLSLGSIGHLDFYEPDSTRFSALDLCYEVLEEGKNLPCALNAANECAVASFLEKRIPYLGIVSLVRACLDQMPVLEVDSYEALEETDIKARTLTKKLLATWQD